LSSQENPLAQLPFWQGERELATKKTQQRYYHQATLYSSDYLSIQWESSTRLKLGK
jgi:hypothetical protein